MPLKAILDDRRIILAGSRFSELLKIPLFLWLWHILSVNMETYLQPVRSNLQAWISRKKPACCADSCSILGCDHLHHSPPPSWEEHAQLWHIPSGLCVNPLCGFLTAVFLLEPRASFLLGLKGPTSLWAKNNTFVCLILVPLSDG